jgi:signal transduction histidine kinase
MTALGPVLPVVSAAIALVLAACLRRERQAGAARAELVARACHEARGPLTAAHLALHALQRRGVPVTAIEDELWRAASALEDLAAAPARSHALDDPEPVDLAPLLRRQAPGWQDAARERGCTLEVRASGAGLVVLADPVRLARAIANLVANALEHGQGAVEVSARVVGGRVAVEVCDEGPGLPMPLTAIVARPRAGRGARGRGLAIVTEIATRHGGCVATAPSARGARLVLELPAWRAVDGAAEVPGP